MVGRRKGGGGGVGVGVGVVGGWWVGEWVYLVVVCACVGGSVG